MSDFLSLLPEEGWRRLAVDALWQSTLILVIAGFVSRWLVKQAAARAWVLVVALTACIVSPLGSLAARSAGWGVVSPVAASGQIEVISDHRFVAPSAPSSDGTSIPRQTLERTHVNPTESAPPSVYQPTARASRSIDWFALTGTAWVCASAVLFVRLALSFGELWRMMRRAALCNDSRLVSAACQAAERVGLASAPQLAWSDSATTPMVLALGRPTILLPPATPAKTAAEIDWPATFAHELAHVVRGDGWWRLWVELVAVVLPCQPLVWLARRAFHDACEEACDDVAVAAGSDPIDLAATLTAWMQRSSQPATLVAIGMSATKARTLRLLALRARPLAGLAWSWRWMTVAAAAFLVSVMAAMQTSAIAEPQNVIAPQPQTAQAENERKLAQPPRVTKIAGVCVDEKNAPIAGASVKLFAVNYTTRTQRLLLEVEANEKGQYGFSIGDMPDLQAKETGLVVIAQAEGKATTDSSYFHANEGGERNLTLPPAGKMTGRVTDVDGKPIAGAIVATNGSGLLDPIPGIGAAATDADGRYEIADLRPFDVADQRPQPAGRGVFIAYGASIGQVRHPDYARETIKYTKVPSNVDVTLRRAAIVNGVVLLSGTRQAAIGARIEFGNDDVPADYWTRAVVDELGEYHLASLPPGTYRMSITLKGYPNLFRQDVVLKSGPNRLDLELIKGAVINGRVIDVSTEKPITLAAGQSMQISESTPPGVGRGRAHYSGMNYANIRPDGTFTLLVPAGRAYLGMYFGENWQGVNTDRLLRNGIEVGKGQTVDLEIRVRPLRDGKPLPLPPPQQKVTQASEQAATDAINQLGGWVKEETVDGEVHVVEVNMAYYVDERQGRQDNRNLTDEALAHVRKFTRLKRLYLKETQATDAGLANLRGMQSLEDVIIWDGRVVTDAGAAHLATLPNLTRLSVSNAKLTDESLRLFSKIPKLESIGLQGNHFTDQGLEHLKDMTQLKSLYLGLGQNEITDDGLRHLAKLTNLEQLDLQRSKITDEGLKHLVGLKKLRALIVNGTGVTEPAVTELRKVLPELRPPRYL
jgi:beta-lactamase regulating signal transducer with metallopeptidase domain